MLLMGSLCNAQIKVNSNGYVGIGNSTPQHNLDISGDFKLATGSSYIYSESGYGMTGLFPSNDSQCWLGYPGQQYYAICGQMVYQNRSLVSSDKRGKENIRAIESPLNILLQIQGKKYDFKSATNDADLDEKIILEKEKLRNGRLGFLAQDLAEVLPEAVHYYEDYDRYFVDYDAIIPVLVEAMKEQQSMIDALRTRIDKIEGQSVDKSVDVTKSNSKTIGRTAKLKQNIPNPFSNITRIGLFLPITITKAILYVYNMQGVQLKSFPINERGNTSVTIEGNTLEAGMYLYTLIADGKEVDTKKMILTK